MLPSQPNLLPVPQDLPGIDISARNLFIENGGTVTTSEFTFNDDSRAIIINVTDNVLIKGSSPNQFENPITGTRFFSNSAIKTSKTNGIGNAGNIKIRARNVSVLDGGQIESDISANSADSARDPQAAPDIFQGKSGDIVIDATESIVVNGSSINPLINARFNLYASSAISTSVSFNGNAQGGKLSLTTGNLQVTNGGQISSDVLGRGNAGEVEVNARGNITIGGVGRDQGQDYSSSITSRASASSSGNAGLVRIVADSLNLKDGGKISTNTSAAGNAGKVDVNISGDINIDGVSLYGDPSQISSASLGLSPTSKNLRIALFQDAKLNLILAEQATGDGGNVQVTAKSLRLSNSGKIEASSNGQGLAGNLNVQLRGDLLVNNGEIKTTSEKTAGGKIDLTARAIVLRNNGNIKTNIASGSGQGGSITLTAPSGLVLLEDSDILAFAKDGRGGNISLLTPALLTRTYRPSTPGSELNTLDTNGFVDINATGATSGIITLPNLNPLQNNRAELPQGLLDADKALSRSCLARNPNTGKFYITGAGGIPTQPGDPTLSNYSTLPVASAAAEPTQIVEADGFYPLDNGKFVFGKACQATEVAS
jgi:large exoprotein involved in heme utilization and adhesion